MHGEEEGGSVGGGVKMKRFNCLTREEGKMGDCQARPVRPVWRTGQTGRTYSARKNPIETIQVNFQSIRENIQRIRDFDHKEVLE